MGDTRFTTKLFKYSPLIIALFVVSLFSWLLWHNIFATMIVDVATFFVVGSEEAWSAFLYWRTPTGLFGDGERRSFRHIDRVPVSSKFENDYDYMIYATGGSDFPFLPFRGGMFENPFIIVPKDYIISAGSAGDVVTGNIHDKDFDDLPDFLQQALENHPCGHFKKKYSKIKMIDVSYYNLSNTSTNINLVDQRDYWINAYNERGKLIKRLQDEIRNLNSLRRSVDETEMNQIKVIQVPSKGE